MDGAQTLILNGLAQTDLDMNNFRLLNLDTSNLPPSGIPPTIVCAASNWLNGWDSASLTWSQARPKFTDINGALTASQQLGITQVGTITSGTWKGSVIDPTYLPTLDLIKDPIANLGMNNFRITNLADPIDPGDAVNKNFMDLLLQGLNPKQAVKCASTTDLTPSSLARPVDGITLHEGDRVLVKDQISPRQYQNGIYIAHTGAWTRATDCDHGSGDAGFNSTNSIDSGAYCVVLSGTVNGGTSWVQNMPIVHIADITNIVNFVIFADANMLVPGNGLNLVGNTLNVVGTANRITVGAAVDIASNYVGQNTITTLGTISTGTWNADIIPSYVGGTGLNNQPWTIALNSNLLVTVALDIIASACEFVIHGDTIVDLPTAGTLATVAGNETFTNKRITKRSVTTATSSAPSIDTDTTDAFFIGALATNITSFTTNLTGSPQFSDVLEIWIKDNGVPRTIAWGTAFTASTDLPLPTDTTASKWLYLKFIYNATLVKWVLVNKLDNIS